MGKKLLAALLLIITVVSSQAQTSKQNTVSSEKTEDPDNLATEYFSQIMGVAMSATSNLKLYQFIYDWIGTPYRFGGESKNGIDCSAFTKAAYEKVFNVVIGRNSRNIFTMVNPIMKDDLQQGDLVFFKIKSSTISHIGIYIGDNKFAHASNKGVAISNLNEPYYQRYFYKGGRLFESVKDQLEDN